MKSWLLPQLLGLVLLFLLGSFFSSIETALLSFSRHRLVHLKDKHPRYAPAIQSWMEDPNRLLTTMLIGNSLVAVSASALATTIMLNLAGLFGWRQDVAIVASIAAVALIVIMFGEIIPKIVALHNPERVILSLLLFLYGIAWVLTPVTRALVWVSNSIIHLFGGKTSRKGPFVTEAEILSLLSMGEQEGVLERQEREMITGVLEFTDATVAEVMVPRVDMVAAECGKTVEEMVTFAEEAGHSRIPVYRETVDNIVGVLYTKDLLKGIAEGKEQEKVEGLLREAYFVPENKRLVDLLKEFQKKRMHLALVVDEYGGTSGLVTLEDLLEEIVGEIRDEYDTEEPLFRRVDAQTLRVDARIGLEELSELLGTELPEGEYQTLGGLVMDLAGRVPKEGESVRHGHLEFVVEKVLRRRILNVKIIKN
jgi:CBS domain containing-hemolysin-like protein